MHIIESGNKQYIVEKGDELIVDKLNQTSKKIEFIDLLSGKKIEAQILGEKKAEKVSMIKFKAKKRYLKRIGQRQTVSRIKINE